MVAVVVSNNIHVNKMTSSYISCLNFMVKKCARQHCVCQKRIQDLSLRIAVSSEEEKRLIREEINEAQKFTRGKFYPIGDEIMFVGIPK